LQLIECVSEQTTFQLEVACKNSGDEEEKSRGKSKETKNECTNEQLQKIRIKTIWTAKIDLKLKSLKLIKRCLAGNLL